MPAASTLTRKALSSGQELRIPQLTECVVLMSGESLGQPSDSRPRRSDPKVFMGVIVAIVVGVLLLLAVLQSVNVHLGEMWVEDPDEPEVPDDYDCVLLEGKTGAEYLHITLTVKGEIQPGSYEGVLPINKYEVGVWVRESSSDHYVYRLKYIEGEEVNYGVDTTVDGDRLMFEFPLSFVSSGAYITGISAVIHSNVSLDVAGEQEACNGDVQKLLTLPVGPFVLVAAAVLVGVATIMALEWPLVSGMGRRKNP